MLTIGSEYNLDNMEKDEVAVRTKAPEMIGCLSCILWIYNQGLEISNNFYTI